LLQVPVSQRRLMQTANSRSLPNRKESISFRFMFFPEAPMKTVLAKESIQGHGGEAH
jgi:hypothetical protein